MQIGRIEGAVAVIGRAQGYNALPIKGELVHDLATGKEAPAFTTAWLPTPEELVALNAGAAVHVQLLYSQPPITVTVGPIPE